MRLKVVNCPSQVRLRSFFEQRIVCFFGNIYYIHIVRGANHIRRTLKRNWKERKFSTFVMF